MPINEQPSVERKETEQYKAFESRVRANLHVPYWSPEVMQYFNERPQFIPSAFKMGFETTLVRDEASARKVLERFIWSTPLGNDQLKKFVIWFTRQSKGLVEEIKLYSPFDPDEQTEGTREFGHAACHFIDYMNSSGAPNVSLCYILNGIGCPVYLASGSNNNEVFYFYLTLRPYDARNARRIKWEDAIRDFEKVEKPS